MYLVSSALTSSPISLAAATKASAFSFRVKFVAITGKTCKLLAPACDNFLFPYCVRSKKVLEDT